MKNKTLLLGVAIIFFVAMATIILSSGVFEQTTEVDHKFLKGTIPAVAIENHEVIPRELGTAYDSEKTVRYVFGMADSLNFYSKEAEEIGAKKLAPQTINGVEWNIYFLTPRVYKKLYNVSAYGYICVASGKTGDYFIDVSSQSLIADESLQSELFTKYTKPFLESIEFKDPEDPPKEYQQLSYTKEEFDELKQLIEEYGWDYYIEHEEWYL